MKNLLSYLMLMIAVCAMVLMTAVFSISAGIFDELRANSHTLESGLLK